jgi:cytochrome c-type biogenesis protein CcmH/NrfF
MRRWKTSFLLFAVAALCLAQTEGQLVSDEVKRVGRHISCQCGGCNDDATCMMSAGQCWFCKRARTKIWRMQQAGLSDKAVADEFIKEYGATIYRADPNAFGWLVPYAALAFGTLVLVWFVRRYRQPVAAAPAAAQPDEALNRYREQIEQDVARLE